MRVNLFVLIMTILVSIIFICLLVIYPEKAAGKKKMGLIVIIALLIITLLSSLFILIWQHKSNRFKSSCTITNHSFRIVGENEKQVNIAIADYLSYEVIKQTGAFINVKLNFTEDRWVYVETTKFRELKIVLDQITDENNKNIQSK